jgi:hypothetical protein
MACVELLTYLLYTSTAQWLFTRLQFGDFVMDPTAHIPIYTLHTLDVSGL